ncbi:MAG TPA: MFS transporter [Thermoplasmata archaeon]|nr:MFS transporter [Thermoplasmata archaeon]
MPVPLEPLRHPTFRRFFAGQAVSQLGDFVFFVALPWQILLLTNSTATLGGVFAAYFVAQLGLLLVGGVIVDRFSRRRLVVLSDILQGVLVAGMAALAYAGTLSVPAVYAFAALFGAAQAFAMPALQAFVPETVPATALQSANGLYQGTRTLMGIAGPALGAALIAVAGTAGAFAFDAATFGVSAALLASARTTTTVRRRTRSPLAEIREGWRYVARIPWLWITILLFAIVNAAEAGPRNTVLPAFVAVDLGGGATAIGLVLSAQAVGTLFGFLLPGAFPPIRDRGLVAYAMTALIGASILLLGFATALWQVVALAVVHGVAVAVFSLMWATAMMEYVDEDVRGRAFSVDEFGSFALLPISMGACGFLAAAYGASIVFVAGGVLVIACAIVGFLHKPARTFRRVEVPRVGTPPE